MGLRSIPSLAIFLFLCLLSCERHVSDPDQDKESGKNKPPAVLYTSIDWVGTDVLFGEADAKRDFSVLFIFTSRCVYCEMLQNDVLTDSAIIQVLGESFNSAKINLDVDTQLVYFDSTVTSSYFKELYDIWGVPTSIFLSRDGSELWKAVGLPDRDFFFQLLCDVRAGRFDR